MTFHVVIKRYLRYGLNGDRSTRKVPYYDYAVVVIRADGQTMTMQRYEGYNSFWSAPASDQYHLAEEMADNLADFLGATLMPMETYEAHQSETWVRVP